VSQKNNILCLFYPTYLNKIFLILKYYIFPYFVFFLITFFLFRDNITLGMQFDEVIRINNLIPLINPDAEPYNQSIFNISLLGFTIPLMYKFYLSTALLIPYIPLFIFHDNLLFGLRFLYGFYFFLSISILFFILSKKLSYPVSFLTSLLVITSPVFYPEVFTGRAHSIQIIFLTLAVYFLYVFFEENRKSGYLFLGTFLFFIGANIEAFLLWVIAAVFFSSIIIFPQYWKIILESPKYCMILLLAFILGWLNFFIYNILSPFSTIKPLYLKIFDPVAYNQMPVDYVQTAPLLTDVSDKITIIFPSFFNRYGFVYCLIIIALIALYFLSAFQLVKSKQISEFKAYFFPFFCFCLVFIFILISPKTTRAGHYVYIIPLFEISIVTFFLLGEKIFNKKVFSRLLIISLICLVLMNSFVSSKEIISIKESKGVDHFSPAIFKLNEYFHNESLQSDHIVFLEWGMYTQLYFLNKGEFDVNSLVFQLYDTKSYDERKATLKKYFSKPYTPGDSDTLYFPLYHEGFDTRNDAILADFKQFVYENNGTLNKISTFYETNGDEAMSMYELEHASQFFDYVKKSNNKTMMIA